jgi:protein-tyrosine-phosphatase
MVGSPMCELSETEADALLAQWPPDPAARHQSRQLDSEITNNASLILTADRQHRRSILMESPRLRERVFTLRQAGRLSTWLTSPEGSLPVAQARALGEVVDLDPLDPRFGVPPLPKSVGAKLQWFCSEMDAARGLAGHTDVGRWPQWDIDDIGDPHVEGTQLHADSSAAAVGAALQIAAAIAVIHSLPQDIPS